MVATIDPTTGRAAVVSIPRDMSGIPLAGGGNSGSTRVNSIYYLRYRDPALPHAAVDRKGLKKFSRDIGTLLGTEIDYWALTRFAHVRQPHQHARWRTPGHRGGGAGLVLPPRRITWHLVPGPG